MAFPAAPELVTQAESALGVVFPPALRARLLHNNGGDIDTGDDVWQLFPVQDMSDRKRAARTANHIVSENSQARAWAGFPAGAIAIAGNGSGDLLVYVPEASAAQPHNRVLLWEHDTGELRPVHVNWDL